MWDKWKDGKRTCEKCRYQVMGQCRLNPPTLSSTHSVLSYYPFVAEEINSNRKMYQSACSKYEEVT